LLYFGITSLIKTDATSTPPDWTTETVTSAPGEWPFVLRGHLHSLIGNQITPLWIKGTDGTWSSATPVFPVPGLNDPTAFWSASFQLASSTDRALMNFNGRALVLQMGVVSVDADSLDLSSLSLGQRDSTVLSFGMTVSLEEILKGLTVSNLGTAIATRDIQSLKLFQSGSKSATLLATLDAGSDGKTWSLPSSSQISLQDGEHLTLAVTIDPNAQIGATCKFSIPTNGFQWGVTQTYQLPAALTEPVEQTIVQGSIIQPINGVMIYPNPGHGTIRFLYDLNSISDVRIKIFNLRGQMVSELSETAKPIERHATTLWDTSGIAPDVYVAQIRIVAADGSERNLTKRVYLK
jgi:hypothetical protein